MGRRCHLVGESKFMNTITVLRYFREQKNKCSYYKLQFLQSCNAYIVDSDNIEPKISSQFTDTLIMSD